MAYLKKVRSNTDKGESSNVLKSEGHSRQVKGKLSLGQFLGKLHCGDCVKIMRQMPKESVDVIVTSPPYNIRNSSGNGLKDGRGGKWANASLLDGYKYHNDNMPHDKYVRWQKLCLNEMMRILRDNGAIFYNHKWRVQNGLLQDRSDILDGLPVRQIIIWKRKGGINFNAGYFLPTYEVIYLIAKPKFKLKKGANNMGDVWEIPQTRGIDHPAPFPIELAQRCIESTSGKIVLDPFMGSGTVAIAANILMREWIGIDLVHQYCETALQRLSEYNFKTEIKKHV